MNKDKICLVLIEVVERAHELCEQAYEAEGREQTFYLARTLSTLRTGKGIVEENRSQLCFDFDSQLIK